MTNFQTLLAQRYEEMKSSQRGLANTTVRERAWEFFRLNGLPDQRHENWKYSNLKSWTEKSLLEKSEPLNAPLVSKGDFSEIEYLGIGLTDFQVLQISGGKVLNSQNLDKDIQISSNEDSLNRNARLDLSQSPEFEDGLQASLVASSKPGVRIFVPSTQSARRPLLIHYTQKVPGTFTERGAQVGTWDSGFHSLTLEEKAELDVIEIFSGDSTENLRTCLFEIEIKAHAKLNWVRLQAEKNVQSYSLSKVYVNRGSQFKVMQILSDAKWCRSEWKVELIGEESEAQLGGIVLAQGKELFDQRIQTIHKVGENKSSQLFKGVIKDFAKGNLNGKIFIAPQAQKVASSQLNHNLLLSKTGEANTKPELEIYADDVKANHGASVGRLDDSRLFYLLSRGIPRELAEQLLARAFVEDVVLKCAPNSLKYLVDKHLEMVLPEFIKGLERQV